MARSTEAASQSRERTRVLTGLGHRLVTSRPAQLAELVVVFGVGVLPVAAIAPRVADDPLARGAVVWVANLLMLAAIWLGLRLRGQGWEQLGLTLRPGPPRAVLRAVLLSVVVFVAALFAFVAGAIVMAMILGRPEPADMSGYAYLRGNLPVLLVMLPMVYLASSLGEEVTHRGFLITRVAELGAGGRRAWRLAVLVSAVVFGLAHFGWGVAGMVQTGLMGLALGVAYLALGRRLWPLILAHAYLDTILLLQVYFAPPP